jgi:glycogen synthase
MAAVAWVIVPSTWWENAPLIILEAFRHRRPVICSDIGGMAEMVEDGVSGLHFRAGDAADLARTMRRAASERGLFETLQRGMPEVPQLNQSAAWHAGLYDEVLGKGGVNPLPDRLAQPSELLPEHNKHGASFVTWRRHAATGRRGVSA